MAEHSTSFEPLLAQKAELEAMIADRDYIFGKRAEAEAAQAAFDKSVAPRNLLEEKKQLDAEIKAAAGEEELAKLAARKAELEPLYAKKVEVDNAAKKAQLDALIAKVAVAQKIYATYSQEQVDKIFEAAAMALCMKRLPLAQMAVQETGMGVMEDKVIKNHFASEFIYNKYKNTRTVGMITQDKPNGYSVHAEPLGVIAGIVPTTNPTSTTIFKALLALKTRNGIIFSPHPRAAKCTCLTAKICLEAAVKAGAPEDIVAWIERPSVELTSQLMKHRSTKLILATGGSAMVRAAYESGNPAIGVGPGNTPAIIDETADVETAVASLITSKTFDNGMICASEQTVVVHDRIYERVKYEFMKRGCHFVSAEEKAAISRVLLNNGVPSAAIVGQPAAKIVEIAGLQTKIPAETRVLIAECTEIGHTEPWSLEKLSPTLGMFRAESWEDCVEKACALVKFGLGHTSSLFTHPQNSERIYAYSFRMPTGRVLINSPSSQGAIGDIYNFMLAPSLTIGCGSWGGNSVAENLGPKHLLNYKTVAERRENMLWMQLPPRLYFKYGCMHVALTSELYGKKKCFLVTDKVLFELGLAKRVVDSLATVGCQTEVFYDVEPDPTFETVFTGLKRIKMFKPDAIVALGGGSPMDAAKIMWFFYEYPEFEGKLDLLCARFMDIRKRIYALPKNPAKKCSMVCIPTTSGTGSEVTPFAVITDGRDGVKYPIADYALTPDIAIADPELCLTMPRGMVAATGLDVLTHAIESYVSTLATPFTMGYSLQAITMTMTYLERSYVNGGKDQEARENVHYAATIAGIAFANAFLGICHSCAHKLGAAFHVPHGIANALLLPAVVYYNSASAPTKYSPFPQYTHAVAKERYAHVADTMRLGGSTLEEKVLALCRGIDDLKRRLNVPTSIKEYFERNKIPEEKFFAALDDLAIHAFDDQCTGSNPRYPLVSEIKNVYLDAWHGTYGKHVNSVLDSCNADAMAKIFPPGAVPSFSAAIFPPASF